MEDILSDIKDHLDTEDFGQISEGLEQLDLLLSRLLPEIVKFQNGSVLSASNKGIHTGNGSGTSLNSFIALQDSFRFNVASSLLNYYSLVSSNNSTTQNLDEDEINNATLKCNRLLQGLLLLHPESRSLFHRQKNMDAILGLFEKNNSIEIAVSMITTLIHILLKDLVNFRNFEENYGCSILIRRFKLSSFDMSKINNHKDSKKIYTQQDLNFKIIEFLIFYLIDEHTVANPGSESKAQIKTVEEKSNLFRKDFPEIDSLIENLNELKDL
ncbi:hypothetical protein G9P44_004317 [Scheffersomyces stipitis]|nr:hypothetical protein G9P44_004317 [Scheffersomyces stipitis]